MYDKTPDHLDDKLKFVATNIKAFDRARRLLKLKRWSDFEKAVENARKNRFAATKKPVAAQTVLDARKRGFCSRKTLNAIQSQVETLLSAKGLPSSATRPINFFVSPFKSAKIFIKIARKGVKSPEFWRQKMWLAFYNFEAAVKQYEQHEGKIAKVHGEIVKHSEDFLELYKAEWMHRGDVQKCHLLCKFMVVSAAAVKDDVIDRLWSHEMAVRYHESGMYYSARKILERVAEFKSLDSRAILINAHMLHRLALITFDDGEVDLARQLIDQSAGIKNSLGAEGEFVSDKIVCGMFDALQGEFEAAMKELQGCMREVERLERREISITLDHRHGARFRLARTFRWMGDFERARRSLDDAERFSGSILPSRLLMQTYVERALLQISANGDGKEWVKKAVEIAEKKRTRNTGHENFEPDGTAFGREASNLAVAILLADVAPGSKESLHMDKLSTHLARTPVGVRYRASAVFGCWKAKREPNAKDEAYALFVESEAFADALIRRKTNIYDLLHWKGVALAGQGKTTQAADVLADAARTDAKGICPLVKAVLRRLAGTELCKAHAEELEKLADVQPVGE